jgi:hypothetical protein
VNPHNAARFHLRSLQDARLFDKYRKCCGMVTKTVLLVEDNEDDILVMKMACKRTGIPHALQVVTDGDQILVGP